ncbi:MAG: adenosylcobinamide-GDP ribazoletransferase [Betaproteobacteria bacterium]|nr:MAG: adenosylcobinamide-GDP ribazoletransferase [Betaproteobacteria bacterium]
MRELIFAFQFMTRLPMPRVAGFTPLRQARAAGWFPVVGLVVGALVAVPLLLVPDPRLAALLALVVWVGVTGGLHLDGLADLADALGATHSAAQGDRERFLAVLADPHIGSFGVIAVLLQLLAKFVLLWLLAETPAAWWTVPVIAAWARFGALFWGRFLPPLKASGLGVAWRGGRRVTLVWGVTLLALCAVVSPVLLIAPLGVVAWWAFLRVRVGGMTGDCLGAGIELIEVGLLFGVLSIVA